MAPTLPEPPVSAPLPRVRLELQQNGRSVVHDVGAAGFLIGGVPGCDLRLPGTSTPPVLCLITCQPEGVVLRKLAPVFPVLVNGRAASTVGLSPGDRVSLGAIDLLVSIESPPALPGHAPRERPEPFEAERAAWQQRQEEIERVCRERIEAATALIEQARQQQEEMAAARTALRRRAKAVRRGEERLANSSTETADLNRARHELATLRQQLYERYRKRRDRLAALQQAVRRAARKVQHRKRAVDALTREAEQIHAEDSARHAELLTCAEELARERDEFEQQKARLEAWHADVESSVTTRLAEIEQRDRDLIRDREHLERSREEHRAALVRVDRLEALLEQRQQQLQVRALEVDRKWEQLQVNGRDLEEQATQLDEWHRQLSEMAVRLEKQKAEQSAVVTQAAQRAAALEAQQAMLASLRTRLERTREEVARDEQALAAQRAEQETAAEELRRNLAEAQRLRAEAEQDRLLYEQERQRVAEAEANLETTAAQVREREEKLAAEEERLRQREAALAGSTTRYAEQADLIRARSEQLAELQKQLEAERLSLRERESSLTQAQKTLAGLQEQLRRRSEELAGKHRVMEAEAKRHAEAMAELEQQRADSEAARREAEDRLSILHAALDGRGQELEQRAADMARREEELRQERQQLEADARLLQGAHEALLEEQKRWEAERRETSAALASERAEVDAVRSAAEELQNRLPDLEARARDSLDRLLRTREQVREQIAEVGAYASQGRQDLEELQAGIQAESERVRKQELELHRARDEHRLAVAAFRQQLIEWQGQVAELKHSLEQGETRLEQRQAELEEQARQADAANRALAEQTQQLQQRQREVEEKRGEVHRHLDDMRQWYRSKLRELVGGEAVAENEDAPSILALTDEIGEGDRQLGDLLRSLGLVDADVLTRLLVEARRQRRSLRQLLLSGGYLTLYQVALIEAGNLDALVLGPVRVIDRLRATSQESVYRVFDPRCGEERVLRHLAEAEMLSAVHPDEFRQRFTAAAHLRHPHLEMTCEVLDIAGRPAVLQEWVRGLPSGEWSALAAVPGVWFRLLCQSALALHTIEQAGLSHGRLTPGSFVLTADGVVKLCGLGEPDWLAASEADDEEETAAPRGPMDDLTALGHIASAWAATAPLRKGAKSKPLPESLQTVLRKLTAELPEERYPSAGALLEELDAAGADVTPNAAAWERLLKQVRELGADAVPEAA